MDRYLDRLRTWYQTALAKLKQRSWRVWLVVVFLLFVLVEVLRAKLADTTTLILGYLFRSLFWLAGQSMGLGGVLVLTFIALLLACSWWESRPRRVKPSTSERPLLTDNDRRLVNDIRVIWNRYGRSAVDQVCQLLSEADSDLRKRHYWADFLRPLGDEINTGATEMDTAVAPDSVLSIEQVRERFNSMYKSYLDSIRFMATLQSHGDLKIENLADHLERWCSSHYEFWDRLQDLVETPVHQRTLKIFVNVGLSENRAYADLLTKAQTRPTLVRRSELPAIADSDV